MQKQRYEHHTEAGSSANIGEGKTNMLRGIRKTFAAKTGISTKYGTTKSGAYEGRKAQAPVISKLFAQQPIQGIDYNILGASSGTSLGDEKLFKASFDSIRQNYEKFANLLPKYCTNEDIQTTKNILGESSKYAYDDTSF